MPKKVSLPSKKLRTFLGSDKIAYETSGDFSRSAAKRRSEPFQPRALKALELSLRIKDRGYNVYLAGMPNLGRTYMVLDFLKPWARTQLPPPDLLYVNNFKDQDKPCLLPMPAGKGREFKDELASVISTIRKEVPNKYEAENYVNKRNALMDNFQSVKDELVGAMESEAAGQGFNLDMDEQGALTLYPLVEGKMLSEEEFERLDPEFRQKLKSRSERLMAAMSEMLRKINKEEQGLKESEQRLDKEILVEALNELLNPLLDKWADCGSEGNVEGFLKELREDMLENVDQFMPQELSPLNEALQAGSQDDFFSRYAVNIFVDNAGIQGAPVIVEDHPTAHNVLGCIERESEMGALVTDFTLIKAGSLHRANRGVLVLHCEDMMQNIQAWEGLLRALRSGVARIEDQTDGQEPTRTKTIEPQPLELDIKIVLIGTDDLYEFLLQNDDRFTKLFKIKAHMQESVERTSATIRNFCHQLARIVDEGGMLPFRRDALAGLVDFSSRLAEDQKKLSLLFPLMRELMIEANAMAMAEGRDMVDYEILSLAREARDYRSNLYEEEFMEQYDRELIRVATSGEAVGRVNGLSVAWYGDYEIGLPHHIACTVGVGENGIVDLEREAQLGGPIHTKAMMILISYLVGQFAQNKPIVLTGSLYFEQSYAHVEGDSASGAELAALLSALAGVPVRLSLAFTGAVNQSGQIMAVGGVTRKIEGFFEVCRRKKLTGEQGVLIPVDNQDHLLLKEEVIEAVERKEFHIYPVRTIEQAMELLTGIPAGKRLANGGYSSGSLYRRVDERLAQLAAMAKKYRYGK